MASTSENRYSLKVDRSNATPEGNGSNNCECITNFLANFGLPVELVLDNGSQFTSQTFSSFCKINGIKHSFTPPYHPAPNGAAECSVQVIKQTMRKMGPATGLKERLANFLLMYRSIPHATTGMRHDELFLRRRAQTHFHCCHQI